jgi:hypothetical protein
MILRKYNTAATIVFPLIARGLSDLIAGASFASGDVKLIKDEGAAANTTNLPTDEGNGWYSLVLTSTEMQAARAELTIIDQSSPKAFEDQAVAVETYGHASAQHELDLDQNNDAIADSILSRALSNVEGSATFRSLAGAVASLVNRRRINAGSLEIYKTNDTTIYGSMAVTSDAAQQPIKELDP